MKEQKRGRIWLGVLAFTGSASLLPVAVRAFPTLYAKVFMGIGLGILIPTIVIRVARDVDVGEAKRRLYQNFAVLLGIAFLAITALSPSDPTTQIGPLLAGIGVALLLAILTVAFDFDRQIGDVV